MKRFFEIITGILIIAIPLILAAWIFLVAGMVEADNYSLLWTLLPTGGIMFIYVKVMNLIFGWDGDGE